MTSRNRDSRRPTPAELGLAVTIGIVATVQASGFFIVASDHRLSFGDFYPPTEHGAKKVMQVADDWYVAFAATDVTLFVPIFNALARKLKNIGTPTAEQVAAASEEAYSEILRSEFAKSHLAPLGYNTVEDFRDDALPKVGREIFGDYLIKLAQFDIGVEMIVFGFGADRRPRLFRVCNPGKAIPDDVLGYSVVGSGSMLAFGSLRSRPLTFGIEEMIYRVLEAKFAAEAASYVGKTTLLQLINQNGEYREMSADDIDAIRRVWQQEMKRAIPEQAYSIIDKCSALKAISDGER